MKTGRLLHTLEGTSNQYMMDHACVILSATGHAMPVRSLCFSPDSQLLVTGSDDKDMKIYDVYVTMEIV